MNLAAKCWYCSRCIWEVLHSFTLYGPPCHQLIRCEYLIFFHRIKEAWNKELSCNRRTIKKTITKRLHSGLRTQFFLLLSFQRSTLVVNVRTASRPNKINIWMGAVINFIWRGEVRRRKLLAKNMPKLVNIISVTAMLAKDTFRCI